MTDTDHAILLEQIAADLRQRPRERNWIAAFRDCEVLPASQAAEIAGADPETIRRWCWPLSTPTRRWVTWSAGSG